MTVSKEKRTDEQKREFWNKYSRWMVSGIGGIATGIVMNMSPTQASEVPTSNLEVVDESGEEVVEDLIEQARVGESIEDIIHPDMSDENTPDDAHIHMFNRSEFIKHNSDSLEDGSELIPYHFYKVGYITLPAQEQ